MLTTAASRSFRPAAVGITLLPRLSRAQSCIVPALEEAIAVKRTRIAALRKDHSQATVGSSIRVENVLGGARGLVSMLWEGSVLDANEGIRFHKLSLPELLPKLPEPQPESMFWFLLIGKIPSQTEAETFSKELLSLSTLSPDVERVMDSLPRDLHPMQQLQIGVSLLSTESKFTKAYSAASPVLPKAEYWRTTLDDSLALVAKLPTLATRIFRHTYFPEGSASLAALSTSSGDLIGNYASALKELNPASASHSSSSFADILKLYITLHADHEGGNVSAHATHLVGSALSNPFQAYAAGLAGLAGPLHGLANQEVLRFILDLQASLGGASARPTDDQIKEYIWQVLNSGRVIPGYGHGVLRKTDPRFVALQEFIVSRADEFEGSEVVRLVRALERVAPGVLTEHGKTKNPNPNVDATSGALLHHFGLTQFGYYTVIFGVSRAIGCATQLVWDRALGLPIERPKSISLDGLEKIVGLAK